MVPAVRKAAKGKATNTVESRRSHPAFRAARIDNQMGLGSVEIFHHWMEMAPQTQ